MSLSRNAIAAFLIAASVLTYANDIPKTYPSFPLDEAQTAIVVAHVSAGGELPAFPQCSRPRVFCMHSPFWFRAQVLQTILVQGLAARNEPTDCPRTP